MIARVMRFDPRLGYGKLWACGHGALFVHREDLIDVLALRAGDRVECSVVTTERGPRAVQVRPLEFVA